HTRFSRDWSSDVCSSDLGDRRAQPTEKFLIGNVPTCGITGKVVPSCRLAQFGYPVPSDGPLQVVAILEIVAQTTNIGADSILGRSEERRVGKECRSRWST